MTDLFMKDESVPSPESGAEPLDNGAGFRVPDAKQSGNATSG